MPCFLLQLECKWMRTTTSHRPVKRERARQSISGIFFDAKNFFSSFNANIMNISPSNQNQYQPAFKAILVKKLEPVVRRQNVTFYNNATAMLDEPRPFVSGVKYLINAIMKNEGQGFFSTIDILDVTRLRDILKKVPENIFSKRTVFGIIGAGENTTALELDNNEVLSISTNLDCFEQRNFEDFDLPVKKMETYADSQNCGWYIRDKGEPVTKDELHDLGKRIMDKGYLLDDWRTEQACKIKDETFLVDFECAYIPDVDKSFLLGFF